MKLAPPVLTVNHMSLLFYKSTVCITLIFNSTDKHWPLPSPETHTDLHWAHDTQVHGHVLKGRHPMTASPTRAAVTQVPPEDGVQGVSLGCSHLKVSLGPADSPQWRFLAGDLSRKGRGVSLQHGGWLPPTLMMAVGDGDSGGSYLFYKLALEIMWHHFVLFIRREL